LAGLVQTGPVNSIRTVASLIIAITVVQLGQGILSVHLPVTMGAHLSRTEVGLAGAAYFSGFMLGAWLGPNFLARVGHIRVFAAAAATVAAAVIAAFWAWGLLGWSVNRFATGLAVAMLFAAGESWMNHAVAASERGHVIGFYQVCAKAALAVGPFLALGVKPGAPEPFMLAGMLTALAMLPVCFTSRAQPEPPTAKPMALRELFAIAPAAVIACSAAGVINSGVTTLAPLYAQQHFGLLAAASFMAAAWFGALLLQWPAGRVSDRIDRRLVIAALIGVALIGALTLAIANGRLSLATASLAFAVWGAGGLCYYAVAVAHMADRAEPGQIANATSGLLFVWAAGSVVGPPMMGVAYDLAGPDSIFWCVAGLSVATATVMVWRRGTRPQTPEAGKTAFVNQPATSIAASELAYGDADEPGGAVAP
jgi:MFS family permease